MSDTFGKRNPGTASKPRPVNPPDYPAAEGYGPGREADPSREFEELQGNYRDTGSNLGPPIGR